MNTLDLQEIEIDAGAKALRERQMAGRITRAWSDIPKSEKRKWRDHAAAVLAAAATAALKAETQRKRGTV